MFGKSNSFNVHNVNICIHIYMNKLASRYMYCMIYWSDSGDMKRGWLRGERGSKGHFWEKTNKN